MKKILQWTGIVLGGFVALLGLAGLVAYPIGVKKLNQTYPNIAVENVNIPTDADAVARGKHIATIWACTRCHGANLSGATITNDVEMRYGPLVPIFSGIGLFTPAAQRIDHNATRPAAPAPGATAEYGEYLSAVCVACHGNGIGYAVNRWEQEEFIHTFQSGVLSDGRQFGPTMSSVTFREMTDTELTALWLYFTNPEP